MRRVLPFLGLLAIGCARSESFRADDEPVFKTADVRELDLKKNLREDRNWAEQEQIMGDVKAAFEAGSKK
jgi:hypothetical protein